MNSRDNIYLASKPRYEILDGLRGVAALLIVAYHLFETYSTGPAGQIINHGYLAVDFFFVLSGFVIGYAYDDRWDRMTVWSFFKRRVIRLHPMVVYGCAFGALMFYFTGCQDQFPLVDQTPWWMLILVFLWCCTIVPMPASWDIRGWAETNPLNGPVWSLQWEYLANILYALVIRRFTKLWLTVCVVLFGVMTLLLCLNVDWLGVWENRTAEAFTVIGGWSLSPDQLLIGSTRLLYPFFAGLLLSRANRLIKVRGGFWLCSALIAAVLVMPRVGGADSLWTNGVYEAGMPVFRRVVLSALHHPFPAGISSEVVGVLSSRRTAVYTCGCGCVHLCYGCGQCMGCIQVVRPACKGVAESQTLPRQGKESPVVWRAVRVQPSHIVAPCMPFHSCRCLAIRTDVSETLLHGKGMWAFAPFPHIAPRLTSVP